VALAWAAPVYASCRIVNETERTFSVSSVYETRELEPHTTDSFRSGEMTIESDDAAGAALTGFCADGVRFVVRMVHGPRGAVAVLVGR
jgi:hypothetical protein